MRALVLVLTALVSSATHARQRPTDLAGLAYDRQLFPGTTYDSSIPTPQDVLGYRPGDRAALPEEVGRYLTELAASSPRAELREYARSHEGRPLHYLVISSPGNMARLSEIQEGLARLADPRGLSEAEAEAILEDVPAAAWIGYSIHGDETSGVDASLVVAHHLVAGRSKAVTELLDRLVVLIDPMMNPDGRHRSLQQIAEHRGRAPNVDDQSLLHTGYWPWGRGNHYLFDLNRDWILGVHPETRGRIRVAASWHPLLLVDAHEMGPQDTYLFSPPRAPRNPHILSSHGRWANLFAREQSQAFDERNWLYYTGEWNEGWYPGYSDSWGELRGAIGILYEQSGYAEDGVRIQTGDIMTYREAVHRQAVSSLANLSTLAGNADERLRDFLAEKREAVSATGPYANRTFAVLPTPNRTRLEAFLDQMELQGFEVFVAEEDFQAAAGTDQLGRTFERRTVPAGTVLIPNRQPQARLLATMLEFDTPMPDEYLKRERKEILETGSSTIYDLTAWNLTMFYGLEALTLDFDLPSVAAPIGDGLAPVVGPTPIREAIAWVIDGEDDGSVSAAARLLELGVQVRAALKPFQLSGRDFSRGSLVVNPLDNRHLDHDAFARVVETANELGLPVYSLTTGLADGDLPDLGGGYFVLLEAPRIAILTRSGTSFYDYGSIWHEIDRQLAIRHSHLDQEFLSFTDLRRYNVIVLPDRWVGALAEGEKETLEQWVRAGGTLVAIAASAAELSGEESSLSAVRQLGDVLGDLDDYEVALERERLADAEVMPASASIWSHVAQATPSFPWQEGAEEERLSEDELERRDEWASLFMPAGAFLASRLDTDHWLTFGSGPILPFGYGGSLVLMSKPPVETPVRVGALLAEAAAPAQRLGWSRVPEGHELRVRISGLVWPEAVSRLANSALLTRESKGDGQVILFASPPTFRGTARGTTRLLLNALVYGPGLGAEAPIKP